jgi:adenosine deaminase
VHTGAVATLAAHPAQMLAALGYSVSINTDNRTMSCTDVTSELGAARDEFHWDPRQLESAQLAALGAAFCDPDLAGEIAEDLVMAGWEPLYREPGRG